MRRILFPLLVCRGCASAAPVPTAEPVVVDAGGAAGLENGFALIRIEPNAPDAMLRIRTLVFECFREDREPPVCACGGFLKSMTISFGQNFS